MDDVYLKSLVVKIFMGAKYSSLTLALFMFIEPSGLFIVGVSNLFVYYYWTILVLLTVSLSIIFMSPKKISMTRSEIDELNRVKTKVLYSIPIVREIEGSKITSTMVFITTYMLIFATLYNTSNMDILISITIPLVSLFVIKSIIRIFNL